MYLEISGRRTGKTTRLCKDVVSHLDSSPSAVAALIIQFDDMRAVYRSIIPSDYHGRILLSTSFKDIVTSIVELNALSISKLFSNVHLGNSLETIQGLFKDVKLYFDEFDTMDIANIPILENAYYVTTPTKLRSMDDWVFWRRDRLLRLIVANDFIYTSRHGMANIIDGELSLNEAWMYLDKNTFQQSYLSGFDSAEFITDYFDRNVFPAQVSQEILRQIKRQE